MGISKVEYDNETLIDISGDTVTTEILAEGFTAHNSNGDQITGTFPIGEVDTQSALISQIKSALANKVVSGGSGSGLIDVVNFLPTSGIDERAVYRVTFETNCYIKMGSDVKTLGEFLQMAEVSAVPQYYEVDELPTEMVESDFETQVHIYIVRDSGVAYCNLSGEVTTVGQWGFGGGFDKGVTEDVYSETATGVYTTLQSDIERYFIREDSEWVELVSKNSGGESVSEIFWITCDLDPNTLSASNFSHTYDEIIQAADEGKMVKGKGLVSGLPIEYLTFDLMYVGGYSGYITFSAFFRTPIQGQLVCLYINVRMLPDNTIDQDIMIVNTTNM